MDYIKILKFTPKLMNICGLSEERELPKPLMWCTKKFLIPQMKAGIKCLMGYGTK
jgi:hypothetical protein